MTGLELAEKYYNECKLNADDIKEHLDTLLEYASQSNHITELGVRSIVSTWPFILGKPDRLVCVDILHPSYFLADGGAKVADVEDICEELGISFSLRLEDTLKITLEETDLLFIDTFHAYRQLLAELELHANKSRKWIILHDTSSCGEYFTTTDGISEGGLTYAISDFLKINNEWLIKKVFTNNNGLTILERK